MTINPDLDSGWIGNGGEKLCKKESEERVMTLRKKYRVNFGNGQVWYPGSLKNCKRMLRSCTDFPAFIQFQNPETGDWFCLRRKTL